MAVEVRTTHPCGWFTLWEDGDRIGRQDAGYTERITAAYDLGAIGRTLPTTWIHEEILLEEWRRGCDFRRAMRLSAQEELARRMENEHHLHASPRRVRAVAAHRLYQERLWQHIQHGPESRLAAARRRRVGKDRLEEIRKEAIAKAGALRRRQKRQSVAWFRAMGFPWPEDMH